VQSFKRGQNRECYVDAIAVQFGERFMFCVELTLEWLVLKDLAFQDARTSISILGLFVWTTKV
jgi:hypothetical protein